MKNLIQITTLLIVTLFISSGVVLSKEIPVKIKPASKITTSNLDLQEGDLLQFVVLEDILINSKPYIEKGQIVTGTVTSLEENNYLAQPAKIYIENFKTTNVNNESVKLKGIVYKTGNNHQVLGEFIFFDLMRGGEVQIKPEKDEFTIYLKESL